MESQRTIKKGIKVAFSISNKAVSVLDASADELTNYLTKREYQDRLIIEPKKHISEKQTKILKDLMNDLFACSLNTDDDEKADEDGFSIIAMWNWERKNYFIKE